VDSPEGDRRWDCSLSVIHLFSRPREIAEFGGPIRVLSGVILEKLFSVLTAPVLIWFHTRFVLRNLEGKTVSWNTQTRDRNAGPRWLDTVREYWPLPLVGVGLAALAWSISPNYLAWVSPLLIGLLLAIPVAKVSGGTYLFRRLFLTPEELQPPKELSARFELKLRDGDQFIHAVLDPFYNAVHVSLQRERETSSSAVDNYGVSLAAKLFEEGPGALSAQERRALLADGQTLAYLHTLIWKTPSEIMNPEWAKALMEYRTLRRGA
jgi:membrane glycosyltransferase